MRYLLFIGFVFLLSHSAFADNCLNFSGSNNNDADKVFIKIDAPAVPTDIGATDFTIEFWMKATSGANTNGAITAGENVNWINGNIVVDRDINGAPNNGDFGISLGNEVLAFGLQHETNGQRTIVGTVDVCDGAWHHIAVTRAVSSGDMKLFVDGVVDASFDGGPTGDLSFSDGIGSGNDPYLVLGGEKHGFDNLQYTGRLSEMRLSNTIRYTGTFTPPTARFTTDGNTVGLYHLNEGSGTTVGDTSGVGPSNGTLSLGGATPLPTWVTDSPAFSAMSSSMLGLFKLLGNGAIK